MEDTVYHNRKQRAFHLFVAAAFTDLERFKAEQDITSFNALVMKIIPEVKRYVQKRLKAALVNGQIDKGKYKADDFIDQLFIEVYDHFDEIGSKENLHIWLFKKADDLLEETLIDEKFDTFFFENIDDYSKQEWDAMEEKYSTDGGGDLVMMEDFDDISYRKNDDVMNHIFADDDSKELATQLNNELGIENILKQTEMVLLNLPSSVRSVFELFSNHKFDMEEIAKIRKRTVDEVEMLLKTAQKSLQTSFVNRYKA